MITLYFKVVLTGNKKRSCLPNILLGDGDPYAHNNPNLLLLITLPTNPTSTLSLYYTAITITSP
jgi:hypothetical protein